MKLLDFFKKREPKKRGIQFLSGGQYEEFISGGYVTLDKNPEVIAACFRIAQLISSMTIYLMANTEKGDKRIINELSRKIDIEPNEYMTRSTWMTAIVMNMLLYGKGNAIVYPNTSGGKLGDMDVIAPERVTFSAVRNSLHYQVLIDGIPHDPKDLLHFVYNPDASYPWMGSGLRISLKDVADNLAQAQATTKGFMQSKWKPSVIVKVDALTEEFASKEGRQKLLEEYISTNRAGEPWMIPAEQFSVEQIRPLTLGDLAIADTVTLNKRTVASVLGVPAFVLGIDKFDADEWNSFISNTIRPIAQSIEQELTRKLILSPKMYLKFNEAKLYSYDLRTLSDIYGAWFDRGVVDGNEARDKIGLEPRDELGALLVLENYIPVTESGNQKKLKGEKDG